MNNKQELPTSDENNKSGCLKQAFLTTMILFFVAASAGIIFFSYQINQAGQAARRAAAPVGNLWRELTIKATPVILPSPATIVNEINKLSNLETAAYDLQKVLVAETNQDVLWGALGEQLIFEAYGEVIAGIDLTKLDERDLQIIDPDTIMVHLPDSEILHYKLDNQLSRVIDRDKGLLASVDPQLETQVRQAAENEILEAALENGILTEAAQNAEESMQDFLNKIGFENVIFTDDPPPPAPPYVQPVPKGVVIETPVP